MADSAASFQRRGGIQQRLAASESSRTNRKPSKLYEYLLTEFSWGRMSPQQVQAISALAISDMERASTGEIFYDLYFLSNIGTQGRHLNNCYRDLINRIEKTDGLLPVTAMEIPTKRGDCMAEVLLPHEVFAHMYHHDYEQFVKQFLPLGQDDLVKFWSQCRETPSFKDTPGYKSLKPKYCIPIGLHGDEVPVAGRGKCYCTYSVVFSWFSLVSGQKQTLESLLLLWCSNPAQFVEGDAGTLQCFWNAVAWSLEVLESGRWPSKDYRGVRYAHGTKEYSRAGKLLAEGFYCILTSLVGDLDYTNKFLQMPHWASASRPCNLCLTTSHGPDTWKDFRSVAPWRSKILTTTQWYASSDRSACPLFRVPSINGLVVQPDLMHCKYLGYMQFFLGSVLYLLTHVLMPSTPISNLRRIGLMVRRIQNREAGVVNKFPLNAWSKLSIFLRKKGYPKLRAKAAQIQDVSRALARVWNRFAAHDNVNQRRIKLVFQLDQDIETTLSEYAPKTGYYALPANVAQELRKKQIQLSQLMVMLEEFYADEARQLFNTVSKLHYTAHIVDSASTMHPHLNWCWKGEDFMQKSSVLLGSCLRGRSDVSATVKAIHKYRYALYMSWKR